MQLSGRDLVRKESKHRNNSNGRIRENRKLVNHRPESPDKQRCPERSERDQENRNAIERRNVYWCA
jgi:hypothetical protein